MERVYSDALAAQVNGKREFVTGLQKRADVYVPGTETLIEVKYRPRSGDVREAIAQLKQHRKLMGRGNLRLHAVLGQQREARAANLRAIDEHRAELAEEAIALTVETARDLPMSYTIAGAEFRSEADITRHCEQVKRDFLAAEYLCVDHRSFLMVLADGYCRRHRIAPVIDVVPSVVRVARNAVMALSVHNKGSLRAVSIADMVRGWTELTHYHWIHVPNTMGVCR